MVCMKKRNRISPRLTHLPVRFLMGFLAVCLFVTPTFGWSAAGHRIIGAAAAEFLTPEAKAGISELLRGKTIAKSAVWADHIRPHRKETFSYHYINLPLGSERYDPARDELEGPTIIKATERFAAELADRSRSASEREEALKFLLHFVGDLHQPLHCASNHDAGGNATHVRLNGKAMNLHHLWDMEIISFSGLNDKQYAEVLRDKVAQLSPADRTAIESGTIVDWVMETHRLASGAYQLPENRHLDDSYLAAHQGTVEQQLIKAIVRLTLLLNRAFAARP